MLEQPLLADDVLARMRCTGDPLADAVIEELLEVSGSSELLQSALRNGLESVPDAPPAILAFLNDLKGAAPPELDSAPQAYMSVPPFWTGIGLTLALLHIYSSPSIAAVLARTGKLSEATNRRLTETGKWLNTAMLPGALKPGAAGYLATVQVRLLHARIRAGFRRQGLSSSTSGAPMNQFDMARTWLSFWYLPVRSLRELGFQFEDSAVEQLRERWSYIGHLMGVPTEVLTAVNSWEDAEALFELLSDGSPDGNSRTLAAAIPVFTSKGLIGGIVKGTGCAVIRRIFGGRFADEMGIGSAGFYRVFVPVIVWSNRRNQRRLRTTAGAWQKQVEDNIARYSASIEKIGLAEYQR